MKKLLFVFCAVLFLLPALPVTASEKEETAIPVALDWSNKRTAAPDESGSTSQEGSEQPSVLSFDIEESGGGTYRVSWRLDGIINTVYVRIFVTQKKSEKDGILVGSTESGTRGTLDVTMPDIDCGYYLFGISATSMEGAVGYAYADHPVFYDNITRTAPLQDVTIARGSNEVYIFWEGSTQAQISFYDADSGENLVTELADNAPVQMSLPKKDAEIRIGVAPFSNGIPGRFHPVLSTKNDVTSTEITFPEETATNKTELEIEISPAVPEDQVRTFLNGTEVEPVSEKPGQYRIALTEGLNEMMVFTTDEKGKSAAASASVVRDTTAPELTIIGQTDNFSTTDEEIMIRGDVDSDATLTYLGEKIELSGGCFSISKPLGYGKNQFTLVAEDQAGNRIEKQITVERKFWTYETTALILLLITIFVIAVIEIRLLFYHSEKKRHVEEDIR